MAPVTGPGAPGDRAWLLPGVDRDGHAVPEFLPRLAAGGGGLNGSSPAREPAATRLRPAHRSPRWRRSVGRLRLASG